MRNRLLDKNLHTFICLLSDVCLKLLQNTVKISFSQKCVRSSSGHMQIPSSWPPTAHTGRSFYFFMCVLFLVVVFIISASTFMFLLLLLLCGCTVAPSHTDTRTHIHKVGLTRQSGVSLVGAEEPCLLLSRLCVPTAPHNRLLHVMSGEALILWRRALWGELRDTPGLRASEREGGRQ